MSEFDNDRVPVSAIKQIIYCKRRFALMFIDQEWASNYKIVEGDFLHQRVNDPFFQEKRGDVYKSRSVPIYSEQMNLYGIADLVEFIKDDDGVSIGTKPGRWRINPVEYKNGKPEKSNADSFQLCAVAMCLEEMLGAEISKGDVYYGKIKRRVEVCFTPELRSRVADAAKEVHCLMESKAIPEKPPGQNCSLCSLVNICMPAIFSNRRSNRKEIQALLKKGAMA